MKKHIKKTPYVIAMLVFILELNSLTFAGENAGSKKMNEGLFLEVSLEQITTARM